MPDTVLTFVMDSRMGNIMFTKTRALRVGLATLLASSMLVGAANAQDGSSDSRSPSQEDLDAATDGAGGSEADTVAPDDGSGLSDASADAEADSAASAAEQAAAANDAIELAAAAAFDEPPGDPIIPQSPPDRPDIPDGSEGDPLATTAPAAAVTDESAAADADAATAPALNEPVAETSAVVAFDDAAESDAALTPQLQYELETAGQSRIVQLDAAALGSALDAETVAIELFDGVTAQLATAVAPSEGALDSEWSSAGESGSDMSVVTFLDGAVLGQFWVGNSQYGLHSIDGSTALIYEYDRELPDDGDDIHTGEDVNGPSGLTAQELGTEGDIIGAPVIEVMIAYDTEARAFYGNVNNVRLNAAHMVNLTNAMYRRSSSLQHMNLTNIYATGTAPLAGSDMGDYLDELTSKSDGRFDAVHPQRDNNGADLIALLSDRFWTSGSFGLAWLPGGANPAENRAYSVSEVREAINGLTYPHELGHNQCAGHDLNPRCGYTDNTGEVSPGVGRKSVMSRRGSCPACTREPVYSNPSVFYQGWRTGTFGVSDNHRVMEIEDLGGVSGGVANYRVGNGTATSVAGIDGKSCIYGSLEQAFSTAPTNSTIYVAPGTYVAKRKRFNFNIERSMDVEQGTSQCEPTTSGAATDVVLQPHPNTTNDGVLEIRAPGVRLERITIEGGTTSEGNVEVENFGGKKGSVVLDGVIIRNGNNPSNGGGLRVTSSDNSATMINNGQIVNNTAKKGGGVWVNGGKFTIADTDNVEDNNATDGAGIFAKGGAKVVVKNDGDVFDNIATADGGGVHLTGGADLTVKGTLSLIGFPGQVNEAHRGGGVFIEAGSTGSKVRVENGGAIRSNMANFGAGVYLLNGELEVNDGGMIVDNVGGNGAGILAVNNPNTSTVVDLNPGSLIDGNTGGFGAGIFMSVNTTLRADGAVQSGNLNRAVISNNISTSKGGGVYLSKSKRTILDTVEFRNNQAVRGGGVYNNKTTLDIIEANNCDAADTAFERYCTEFTGNSANRGGAIFNKSGTLTVDQVAFDANTATAGAQAVEVVGSSAANMSAIMLLNHDSSATGDGSFAVKDTSTLNATAVTSMSNQGWWFDYDGSAIGKLRRVIADTGVGTGSQGSGKCNLHAPGGFGMPGAISGSPNFITTADSAYVPNAASPAADACKAFGSTFDILDSGVRNADGIASAKEYDIGAIETRTGAGFTCFGKAATIVGDAGNNTLTGTGGADVIVGLGGRDTINAGGGRDRVCAGSGKDTVKGQGGNDRINGGSGKDNLRGNAGNDRLEGEGGADQLRGNGGSDLLLGGDGPDFLNGGSGGGDVCDGQAGSDTGGGGCEITISIP